MFLYLFVLGPSWAWWWWKNDSAADSLPSLAGSCQTHPLGLWLTQKSHAQSGTFSLLHFHNNWLRNFHNGSGRWNCVLVVFNCCSPPCQVWLLHRKPSCCHWKCLPNPLQRSVRHQRTEARSHAAAYLQTVPHVLQLAGRLTSTGRLTQFIQSSD